jgi:hypothetical protein
MTFIDPTRRTLAYLRQQAQEWRREGLGAAGRTNGATSRRPAQKQDAFEAAVQQVAHIDPHDPQARQKAFRVYLTAVLMRELGVVVANDPGFGGLVDRVRDTMEADPELREVIRQAGELLLGAARGEART